MTLKASLVLTTINVPIVLDSYYANFTKYGHSNDIKTFCIPDKKTPHAAYVYVDTIRQKGLDITCPSMDEQIRFLERIGFPPDFIPVNSENRRNVGYLMALESGSDFIISIDDDNYCRNDVDFFGEHAVVCKTPSKDNVLETETGWYNICEQLRMSEEPSVYARGFPYYARHKTNSAIISTQKVRIDINAGLWLQDPDIDAITWLVKPVEGISFKGESVILGKNTWSPVNTQNTAIRREVMASYYCVRMGYPLHGIPIERYGDIFSGYFSQACAKHLGGGIRFGTPVANHIRNSHNYMNDAKNEWACFMIINEFLPWLTKECKLEGTNYFDAYISLAYEIEDFVRVNKWDKEIKRFFTDTTIYMKEWVKACKQLG